MVTDAFDHMEEAWKLEGNPFPAEAIRRQNAEQPYSPAVYSKEANEFRKKFVRGGVRGGLGLGFLWSQGPRSDTGFGKTTLMQEIAKEINADLGISTLEMAGTKNATKTPIAAAFASLNNLNATGLYPVLFNAVIDLATPQDGIESVFDKARARVIVDTASSETGVIVSRVHEAWSRIGGTSGPLRSELLHPFAAEGGKGIRSALANVSQASRLRNGLQYLDFALAALEAAGIDHLFIMIDQLEDLATNRSINSQKRSREIGRVRDLLESAPYATRLHLIFTFHARAAQVLDRFWEENRLPAFEVSPSNTASVVLLSGLKDDEQVRDLMRVYLERSRSETVDNDLLPFEPGAINVLREVSDGRPGILLNRAHELINGAAELGLPTISGTFAQKYFAGQVADDAEGESSSATSGDDIDDLLLGTGK